VHVAVTYIVCMLLMYTEIFFLSLAVLLIITHAGIAAGVGKAFSLVCLSVCLSAASAVNTKLV